MAGIEAEFLQFLVLLRSNEPFSPIASMGIKLTSVSLGKELSSVFDGLIWQQNFACIVVHPAGTSPSHSTPESLYFG